ncbi:hypothetical protein CBR_g72677 [Chara braunii]|uniref:Molybdopterin synthase catalytic subunit n=1 Tax=Chara braunii TaxID=69332 RepID=A0A388KA28_CHABU|nr:hypothetical protein CBR_g72677 [Chara braunii]|eukprot:GBG66922.1 hypothetical protein CBR_g72677 [Chara braunii]
MARKTGRTKSQVSDTSAGPLSPPPTPPPPQRHAESAPQLARSEESVPLPLSSLDESGDALSLPATRNGDSVELSSTCNGELVELSSGCNGDAAVQLSSARHGGAGVLQSENVLELTSEPLDINRYFKVVEDKTTGAVASFQGIARDRFEGKKVARLEYEAYHAMAICQLTEICREMRMKWPVRKIAIGHRTGKVEVGEPSVIIVVSSVHRREALEAVDFSINEIKKRVAIWKKEIYEEGDGMWKENEEFYHLRDRLGAA